MLRKSLVTAVLALAVGCTDETGDTHEGEGGSPPSSPTNFVCDDALVPAQTPLRRMSLVQYRNTVSDLVAFANPTEGATIFDGVAPLFDRVPKDVRTGTDKHYGKLSRLDQAVQQEHADAAYAISTAVGTALTSTPERLAVLAGECATDGDPSNDDACLDAFIQRFGERAMRRAVTTDDVAFYREVAGAAPFDAADYADVVAMLLMSPHALFFVEHGADGETGARAKLGAYELASRLSYHFWQAPPDDELFDAARTGDLLTDAGYAKEVDRVFSSPKTREAVREFFREWLENTTLDELDSRVGMPVFDALRGDFTPGPELRERMIDEVADAALYYAFDDTQGTLAGFLESDRSFATTEDLAEIYGTPVWSGGEPPTFPEGTRAGLITRAAFVATGSFNTRPIMKGVFIRKALLCDEIPDPPANAAANAPMLSDNQTTREVVETLTNTGSCSGCHTTTINPLGFATENYDSLGRVRTEQVFYDEETGAVLGSAPVDTTSVPRVDKGDDTESSGAADLTGLITASDKPYACFARHYFRFTFGRFEDLDRDGCALASVKDPIDDGAPLAEALRSIALTPAFRERTFED
ncbi:MAG: DUF1592 domain-containing protein [Polyangiaceae bacterium]